LDTVSREQWRLVNDGSRESLEIRKLITDQVATTPCTDRV